MSAMLPQEKVKSRVIFDTIRLQCAVWLQIFPRINVTLIGHKNAVFVLDFLRNLVDGVRGLDLELGNEPSNYSDISDTLPSLNLSGR